MNKLLYFFIVTFNHIHLKWDCHHVHRSYVNRPKQTKTVVILSLLNEHNNSYLKTNILPLFLKSMLMN